MLELDNLKRLTEELANEVHSEEHGKVWMMLTMILDSLPLIAAILDKDEKPIYQNEYMKAQYRKYHNKDLSANFSIREQMKGRIKDPEIAQKAMETKAVQQDMFFSEVSKIDYKITAIPLIYDGVAGSIILMYDPKKC